MKINKIVISVVCLLLAAVVVVGSWFGVAVARENNDASMQEQWQAGYDSRNSEIAELEKDRQD